MPAIIAGFTWRVICSLQVSHVVGFVMQSENSVLLQKQLTFLKMRVEMIAWRVDELGMSPEIRQALPEPVLGQIELLMYETRAPDPEILSVYEQLVRQTEEALAQYPQFWRSGSETLH
jgi:hypothetical protein